MCMHFTSNRQGCLNKCNIDLSVCVFLDTLFLNIKFLTLSHQMNRKTIIYIGVFLYKVNEGIVS